MFVDNLRLDVIATFEDNEQEHFSCAIWKSAIKSEKKLINYIKKHLLKEISLQKSDSVQPRISPAKLSATRKFELNFP